ncbi:hypothetical protein GF382_03860 [Candidatus Falkowbacteria bacterium]|nr:hypothetical protein [Candidatus Falkowbacteria bacterium]
MTRRSLYFVIPILFIGLFFVCLLNNAQAQDYGLKETMGVGDNEDALIQGEPEVVVGKLIGTILTWVGVIFLALTVMGGITWMTAQGNEQQVERAKQIIIAAFFGLLVVLAAYGITRYIGGTLIG